MVIIVNENSQAVENLLRYFLSLFDSRDERMTNLEFKLRNINNSLNDNINKANNLESNTIGLWEFINNMNNTITNLGNKITALENVTIPSLESRIQTLENT